MKKLAALRHVISSNVATGHDLVARRNDLKGKLTDLQDVMAKENFRIATLQQVPPPLFGAASAPTTAE